MKKYIILSFLTCFSFVVNAQEESNLGYPVKGDHEIGISLGAYNSYITNIENSDLPFGIDYRYAAGASIHYDHYFSKTWSIKSGLRLDPKGSGFDFTDAEWVFDYITIPVLANWHFGKRKRWYLHFGPYLGFLINAKADNVDVKDELESSDSGFDLGIGIKIPIGGIMFFIESDGQTGFKNPSKDVLNDDDFRLTRSAFSIGVIF